MPEMRLDQIVIGERVRRDMGDLSGLADSMKRHGVLHPVVVKSDGTLIAGHRRIEAARLCGWTEIAVTVIDVADLLSAERDENAERKDFTPTEAVAIGRLIEEQHREVIEARRHDLAVAAGKVSAGLRAGTPVPFIPPVEPAGKSGDVVAAAVGMSRMTYYRAKQVVEAAEADPERFGDLPERLESGKVATVHGELLSRRAGKSARNPALNKMRHLLPNREIERATVSLEGICEILKQLKVSELDADKREGWAKALNKSASIIKSTARRLHGSR